LFYIYRQITRKRKNIRAYHFEGQELYKYTFAQRVNIENKTMIFVTECRFDVNFAIITRLFRVVRSEKKLVLQNVFSSINKNLPQLQISETIRLIKRAGGIQRISSQPLSSRPIGREFHAVRRAKVRVRVFKYLSLSRVAAFRPPGKARGGSANSCTGN